jgi:hypothetical protein
MAHHNIRLRIFRINNSNNRCPHSGNNGGLFTITSYGTGGYIALSQQTLTQIGQTYTLTFLYKSSTGFAMPHVFCKDTSGKDIAYFSGPAMTTTNTWTSATMTFVPIPTGTINTELHFDVDSAGTIQLDDLTTNANTSLTQTPK